MINIILSIYIRTKGIELNSLKFKFLSVILFFPTVSLLEDIFQTHTQGNFHVSIHINIET